jgi:hypothetical protein
MATNNETDGDELPINESQLSSDIIEYIEQSQYSDKLTKLLEEIIKLMNFPYSKINSDWIDVYIKILCELIRAEKKKEEKSIQCMLDLYNLFFDPIDHIFLESTGNDRAGNPKNKIIDIIITLMKNYQFSKNNGTNFYRNILG